MATGLSEIDSALASGTDSLESGEQPRYDRLLAWRASMQAIPANQTVMPASWALRSCSQAVAELWHQNDGVTSFETEVLSQDIVSTPRA